MDNTDRRRQMVDALRAEIERRWPKVDLGDMGVVDHAWFDYFDSRPKDIDKWAAQVAEGIAKEFDDAAEIGWLKPDAVRAVVVMPYAEDTESAAEGRLATVCLRWK